MIKNEWEKSQKRFDALWHGEIIDRCCASVVSWKDDRDPEEYFDSINPDDPKDIEDYWKNPQRIHKRNLHYLNQCYFAADSFPVMCPYFAPAGHAEFFGGKVQYGTGTIWFDPTITDLEKQFPVFDEQSPALQEQLSIYKYLVDSSDDKYLVSMPDHVGAADVLSHLMGPENLLVEMMDRPELVSKAIDAINDGWQVVAQKFYDTVKDKDKGTSIGWLGTWGRGRHMQMQCDISVMLSKDMFEEFLVPELKRQMEWIDIPLYHLDGEEQIRHLDLLLDLPKLKMIQWTNVIGQKPASAYIDVFKRIQSAGKGILLSISADEIPFIMESLSSKGLYLSLGANSQEDADNLVKIIEKYTHE